MSATTPTPVHPSTTLDVSQTSPVPFGRLVRVELRKMVDTRAGKWLVGAILLITAVFMVIFFAVADSKDRTFENFIAFAAAPQGFLLPVLGILLITTEWSQRTAMVTFALEPSRSRVIAAKTTAALALGLLAFVVAIAVAALFTLVGGAEGGFEGLTIATFALFLALQLLGVLQGLAYGLILLNTPAAIVAFFVLPIASSIIFNAVSALRDLGPWLDLGTAQQPLLSGDDLSGDQYLQLVTSVGIWILAPLVVGLFRVMRAELK